MKSRNVILIGTAVLNCTLLASCGGNHGSTPVTMMPTPPSTTTPPPTTPPAATTMDLDTAAVLAIVQTQTSETSSPFAVDNGAVAVTPIGDQTSLPISVDSST